ncbi:MAG TPA: ferric reductase-like transmembrane domain-containing protein, partial [Chloroflexota bacterium]
MDSYIEDTIREVRGIVKKPTIPDGIIRISRKMVRNTATRRQPLTFAAPRFWLQPSYILQNCVGYLFWLTVLINAGIIVWLWWNGGNVTGLHDVSGLFDSIGRITGLLGAYALLVQLLLLARIPFVERLTGFDRLTVWHRRNGKLCIYLVLAHVVFITLGYALSDRLSLTGEATALLTKYPGMVAATVGTALMLVTVATSLVIVRKRLPYQTWYLVHLTAYASVVLAWFHQIPTGNELVTNVTAANYWTGMYLMTLGIVIGFRFIQPILGSFAYRLRVSKVEVENPDTVSLYITGRHLEKLRARPGQFFLWRFLDGGRWWESHP